MLNSYQIGESILSQLESRLETEEMTVEELNTATFVLLNVKESRENNVPVNQDGLR